MRRHRAVRLAALLAACLSSAVAGAQTTPDVPEPTEHVYATRGSTELSLHIFSPRSPAAAPSGAVAVFHGGGWTIGEASWAFPIARHFAERGAVGVAVEYRLADEREVTPLDAMADARDAIRWLRANAGSLGIDPERIAAYGWSAGAHLAASAAILDDAPGAGSADPRPNALVLVSPAVSLSGSAYFERLLLGRAEARSASPDEHVRAGLPPTLILQGDVDTVTPLAGSEQFCRRLRAAGNRCELKVYEGYGHLFTPAGTSDDGWPQPDPEVRAAALAEADEFLRALTFLP
jgi:acetyl esterase/lipase